jgi:hypothetical protein
MEPRREESKAPTNQPKEKARRFRIVKLEERIAPGHLSSNQACGGNGTNNCALTHRCVVYGSVYCNGSAP